MPDIFDTLELPTKKRDVFDQIDIFDTLELPEAEASDIPLVDAEPALPPAPVFKPQIDPDTEARAIEALGRQAASLGLEPADSPAAMREADRVGIEYATREANFLKRFPQHPFSLKKQAAVQRAGEIAATEVEPLGAISSALESPTRFIDQMGFNALPMLGAVGGARLLTVKGLQALPATATVGQKVARGLTHAAPIGGMVAGGGLAGLAQEKVLSTGETPQETEARHQEQALLGERPEGKLANLATMGLIARPSISGFEKALAGDVQAMKNIGGGVGLGGALTTANAAMEGRLPTSKELATGMTEGALFSTPTKLGARLMGHGPERTTAAQAKTDIEKVMTGEAPPVDTRPLVSAEVALSEGGLTRGFNSEEAIIAATQGLEAGQAAQRQRLSIQAAPEPTGTLEAGYREAGKDKPSLEQIRQQGATPPDPNRQLGPGAANIEEPLSTFSTSNKEAVVNAERAAIGQDPVLKEARISNAESIDRAETLLEQNPTKADEIVAKLRTDPHTREISLEDSAVLLVNRASIKSRMETAQERVLADDTPDAERQAAEAEFQYLDGKMAELDQAAQDARSTWGRFGQLWQRSMMSDMTLEPMLARERINKGEPLTVEETQRVQREAEEIQKGRAEETRIATEAEEVQSQKAARETLAKELKYHPRVLEYAEGIVSRWETEAVKAKADLMSLMGMTSANPFQTKAITALYKMARAKIGRGAVDAAGFAAEMIGTFGEKVKPFIQPAWDKATKFVTGLDAAKRPRSKKQAAKEAAGAQQAEATEAGITAAVNADTPLDALKPYVKRLAKDYIKAGEKTVEGLETKLHDFFSKVLPDVTPRQLRDIFSDYGTGQPAPTEPVRVTAAQLRSESQKLSALEDLTRQLAGEMEKTGVPPSGDKRVPQSDRSRQLTQKINVLKKELGIVEGDPAKRLASALESMEKRTENRIRDLRFEIASGERIAKQKGEPPTSPKLEALRAELEQVQTEHEAIFGKREITPEQKLKNAIAAAERAEKQATQDWQNARNGIFRSPPAKGKAGAEMEAIRARTKALRDEIAELKALDPAQQATAEMQAINRRKADLAKRKAEYQERIAKGDFEPRARKTLDLSKDPDAVRQKAETDAVVEEFKERQRKYKEDKEWKAKTETEKFIYGTKLAWQAIRNLKLSFDLTGTLQAAQAIAAHPIQGAKVIGRGARVFLDSFFTKQSNYAKRLQAQIKMSPNAEAYKEAGVDLRLDNVRDENAASVLERLADLETRWAGIPDVVKGIMNLKGKQLVSGGKQMAKIAPKLLGRGLRASNESFQAIVNGMRAVSADTLLKNSFGMGKPTKQQLELLGNHINTSTGSGGLKRQEGLRALLFAPNWYLSLLKAVTGQPILKALAKHEWKVAGIITKEYVRSLASLGVLLALRELFSDKPKSIKEVTDPKNLLDPKAGSVKMPGGVTVDLTEGRAAWVALLGQMITGKRMDDGRVSKQRPDQALMAFMKGRLSQEIRTGIMAASGQDYFGKDIGPAKIAQEIVTPLSWRDLDKIIKAEGMTRGSFLQLVNFVFGNVKPPKTK